MYYFEKDYIMRLIHGISRILARMLFNRELEEDGEFAAVMEEAERESDDYLRQMVDDGKVNEAEEKLFDLITSASWDEKQKAALVLSFYGIPEDLMIRLREDPGAFMRQIYRGQQQGGRTWERKM